MKKLTPFLLFAAMLAGFSACDRVKSKYYDYRLKLTNNTSKTIVAYVSTSYPDTSIYTSFPNGVAANNLMAAPGGTINFIRGGAWETALQEDVPSHKLMIFVFDKAIVDNTPWDTIRQHYFLLKRMDITIDSLQAHDFKLTIE